MSKRRDRRQALPTVDGPSAPPDKGPFDNGPVFLRAPQRTPTEELEIYRKRYEAGSAIALIEALEFACDQEPPTLPAWLAREVRKRVKKVFDEPIGLHEAFDLQRDLPASGKKAVRCRTEMRHASKLWILVRAFQIAGTSYSRALDAVLRQGEFPFKRTVADRLFKATDAVQRLHGHPMLPRTRKTHKLK